MGAKPVLPPPKGAALERGNALFQQMLEATRQGAAGKNLHHTVAQPNEIAPAQALPVTIHGRSYEATLEFIAALDTGQGDYADTAVTAGSGLGDVWTGALEEEHVAAQSPVGDQASSLPPEFATPDEDKTVEIISEVRPPWARPWSGPQCPS
ncbi:MAG: hypothetical protein R3C68_02515 [Myxococcota bacterium]